MNLSTFCIFESESCSHLKCWISWEHSKTWTRSSKYWLYFLFKISIVNDPFAFVHLCPSKFVCVFVFQWPFIECFVFTLVSPHLYLFMFPPCYFATKTITPSPHSSTNTCLAPNKGQKLQWFQLCINPLMCSRLTYSFHTTCALLLPSFLHFILTACLSVCLSLHSLIPPTTMGSTTPAPLSPASSGLWCCGPSKMSADGWRNTVHTTTWPM